MTSAIGSRSNWTEDVIIMPPCAAKDLRGPQRPTVWPVPNSLMSLGVSLVNTVLFSKLLINVPGGLLMCKWVKAPLQLTSTPHPLPLQHCMCTEAQSCLRRRNSQISRCGAKPVALSTREPLGVFNSGFSPFPPPTLSFSVHPWRRPVCVCVCVCVCIHESPFPALCLLICTILK